MCYFLLLLSFTCISYASSSEQNSEHSHQKPNKKQKQEKNIAQKLSTQSASPKMQSLSPLVEGQKKAEEQPGAPEDNYFEGPIEPISLVRSLVQLDKKRKSESSIKKDRNCCK